MVCIVTQVRHDDVVLIAKIRYLFNLNVPANKMLLYEYTLCEERFKFIVGAKNVFRPSARMSEKKTFISFWCNFFLFH